MQRIASIFGMVVLWTCASWGQGNVTPGPVKQDPAPIMQADRDFYKATQERRADGWMEWMADDVTLYRGKPVVGKEAVRTEIAGDWADPGFKLEWEPTHGELFSAGTTGYTTGRWTLSLKDQKSGVTRTMHGNYYTVWKKQKDGNWKVIWDGGAADPAK